MSDEASIGESPGRRRGRLRKGAGRARLPANEIPGVAVQGLRARKVRAALSALGIAIGIGAMVAVVGVSASAQANLIAEIDSLGTNLLTVSPGTNVLGRPQVIPTTAVPMIAHMHDVERDAAVYAVGVNVYRTPLVPSVESGGLGVEAAQDNLPHVISTGIASGHFLTKLSDTYPEAVLGSAAAENLQILHVGGNVMVYLGNRWFTVVGILDPCLLDPSVNSNVFISLPVAEREFQVAPNPTEIYVRSDQNTVTRVANLLPPTTDPQDPSGVGIDRPSDVLEARAAAEGQFTTLLLGLGAVALLVGAIGIANIMVISVLERRGEIGLRRALGATRRHISIQFIAESALLAVIGGITGLLLGAGATAIYAAAKDEPFIVPLYVVIAAPCAGLVIGTFAGLYPAAKAARLSPTEALRA